MAKLATVGGQAVNIGGGARYRADVSDAGPHGWGLRLIVTFPFPQ